jgi:hypothetical protein
MRVGTAKFYSYIIKSSKGHWLAQVSTKLICNKEIPWNAYIIPAYNEWFILSLFFFSFGYRYRWVFLTFGLSGQDGDANTGTGTYHRIRKKWEMDRQACI